MVCGGCVYLIFSCVGTLLMSTSWWCQFEHGALALMVRKLKDVNHVMLHEIAQNSSILWWKIRNHPCSVNESVQFNHHLYLSSLQIKLHGNSELIWEIWQNNVNGSMHRKLPEP